MILLDPTEMEATRLLSPVIRDVARWLKGELKEKPAVLLQLPDELQAEAALLRAEARATK